jgi:hypothetical protein
VAIVAAAAAIDDLVKSRRVMRDMRNSIYENGKLCFEVTMFSNRGVNGSLRFC